MQYAYAEVTYDQDRGRWVANLHDGQGFKRGLEFVVDDDDIPDAMVSAGDCAIFTLMVKFNPDDQFATIITPDKVAGMEEKPVKYAYARIKFDPNGWKAVHRYTGEVFSLTGAMLHRPGDSNAAVSHPDSEMEILIRYEEGSNEAAYVDPAKIHSIIGIG